MNVPLATTHEVWTGYSANGHLVMSHDHTFREREGMRPPLERAKAYRDSLGIERRESAVIIEVSRKVIG